VWGGGGGGGVIGKKNFNGKKRDPDGAENLEREKNNGGGTGQSQTKENLGWPYHNCGPN